MSFSLSSPEPSSEATSTTPVSSVGDSARTQSDLGSEFLLSLTVEVLYHAERLGQALLSHTPAVAPTEAQLPMANSNPFIDRAGQTVECRPIRKPMVEESTSSEQVDNGDVDSPNPSIYSQPSPLLDKPVFHPTKYLAVRSPLINTLDLDYPSPSLYSQESGAGTPIASPVPRTRFFEDSEIDCDSFISASLEWPGSVLGESSPRRLGNLITDPGFEFDEDFESPGRAVGITDSGSANTFKTHVSALDYSLFDIPEEEEEEEAVADRRIENTFSLSFLGNSETRLSPSLSPLGTPTRIRPHSSPIKLRTIPEVQAEDTLDQVDMDLPSFSDVSSFKHTPILKYGFDLLNARNEGSYKLANRPGKDGNVDGVIDIESPTIHALLARMHKPGSGANLFPSLLRESLSLSSLTTSRLTATSTPMSKLKLQTSSNIFTESLERSSKERRSHELRFCDSWNAFVFVVGGRVVGVLFRRTEDLGDRGRNGGKALREKRKGIRPYSSPSFLHREQVSFAS